MSNILSNPSIPTLPTVGQSFLSVKNLQDVLIEYTDYHGYVLHDLRGPKDEGNTWLCQIRENPDQAPQKANEDRWIFTARRDGKQGDWYSTQVCFPVLGARIMFVRIFNQANTQHDASREPPAEGTFSTNAAPDIASVRFIL